MKKLLYIGTHPSQTNGYSKVVYNHLCEFSKNKDIYVVCYGIQYTNKGDENQRKIISSNIYIHTASAEQNGFAFDELKNFVHICTPDIIFIYNDPYVCYQYLKQIETYKCKKFVYLDLVYKNMNASLIDYIKQQTDSIFVFDQKIKEAYEFENCLVLHHGNMYIGKNKITKDEACNALNIDSKYIYVLNLNRNTPRKRYDVYIKSVVAFYKKYNLLYVRFILACQVKGSFDLLEIFANECKKQSINLNFTEVFVIVENPQQLGEGQIELLYAASDVGINTCDGEGWGLCNFEHMAFGAPQIVPAHDCFKIYCNEENSIMLTPRWSYYVDNSRDANGGEGFVVDYEDVVVALHKYCSNDELRCDHGNTACNDVSGFSWNVVMQPLLQHVLSSDE